jgi:hypothetical protein
MRGREGRQRGRRACAHRRAGQRLRRRLPRRRGREACAHYAPALRAAADRRARYAGFHGCAQVLAGVGHALAGRLPAAERRRVVAALADPRSVRVELHGARALAALDLGPAVPATSKRLELALVHGEWLITRLGLER